MYRWQHQHPTEATATSSVVFIYLCPENAPVRSKMLHASTKGPFLKALGLEIAKSIEGVEAEELSDAELTRQVYASDAPSADTGPAIISKAAPRGGRRLVKKTKPADDPAPIS